MPGTKNRTRTLQLASTGEGVNGPSYFDMRELASDIEKEFGVRVNFIFDPEDASFRWVHKRMWIRARAYTPGTHGHGDVYAGAALGGNEGAATMPGAMVHALVELWDRLEAKRAEEQTTIA